MRVCGSPPVRQRSRTGGRWRSRHVSDYLIATPVIVLDGAPGSVCVATGGVTIGIGNVGGAFRVTSEHTRLRADIKSPRLRVHASARSGVIRAAGVAEQDEVAGARQRSCAHAF